MSFQTDSSLSRRKKKDRKPRRRKPARKLGETGSREDATVASVDANTRAPEASTSSSLLQAAAGAAGAAKTENVALINSQEDTESMSPAERVRAERQARARQRKLEARIVKCQSFIRGRTSSMRTRRAMRVSWDSKVKDLAKVVQITRAKGSAMQFQVPRGLLLLLIRQFLFFTGTPSSTPADIIRLDVLCAYLCANICSHDRQVHLFATIMEAFAASKQANDKHHKERGNTAVLAAAGSSKGAMADDALSVAVTLRSFLSHFMDATYNPSYVLHLEREQRKTENSDQARKLASSTPRRRLIELLIKDTNENVAGEEMQIAFRAWAHNINLTPSRSAALSIGSSTFSHAHSNTGNSRTCRDGSSSLSQESVPLRLFGAVEICMRLSSVLSTDGSRISVLSPSEYSAITRREVEVSAHARGHGTRTSSSCGGNIGVENTLTLDVASCRRRALEVLCLPLCAVLATEEKQSLNPSSDDASIPLTEPGLFSRLFSSSSSSSSASQSMLSELSTFASVANDSARGAVCALLLTEPGFAAIAPDELVRCLCCGCDQHTLSALPRSKTSSTASASKPGSKYEERALISRQLQAWCSVLDYLSRLAMSGSNDANIDSGARSELFWWSPELAKSNRANTDHIRKQTSVHSQITQLTAPRVRVDGTTGTLVGCSAALGIASNLVCLEQRRQRLLQQLRMHGRPAESYFSKNDDDPHETQRVERDGGESKSITNIRPRGELEAKRVSKPFAAIANNDISLHRFCSVLSGLLPFLPEGVFIANRADDENAAMTVWLRDGTSHKAVAVPALVGFILREGLAGNRSGGMSLIGRICDAILPREGPDRSGVGVAGLDPSLGGSTTSTSGTSGSGFWGTVSSWGKRLLGGANADSNDKHSTASIERKKRNKRKKSNEKNVGSKAYNVQDGKSEQSKKQSNSFFGMFRRSSWKKSRTESNSSTSDNINAPRQALDDGSTIFESKSDNSDNESIDSSTSDKNVMGYSSTAGHAYSPAGVLSLCTLLSRMLWLWPEGTRATPSFSSSSTSIASRSLLSFLSYTEDLAFVPRLWRCVESNMGGKSVSGFDSLENFVKSSLADRDLTACDGQGVTGIICVFGLCFSHLLTVLDDSELYDEQVPLPRSSIVRLIEAFKVLLFRLHWELDTSILANRKKHEAKVHTSSTLASSENSSRVPFAICLRSALTGVLRLLFNRSSCRPLAYPMEPDRHESLWLVPQLRNELGTGNHLVGLLLKGSAATAEDESNSNSGDFSSAKRSYLDEIRRDKSLRAHSILRAMPWCIPFKDRLLLFQHIIRQQRDHDQDGGDVNSAVRVRVRRSLIFEDSLRRLNTLGKDLRKRIYVIFVNPLTGEDETGIDAGGLFKELWTTLSNVAFDPNYGLWDVTPKTHLMYPSANAHLVHGSENHLVLYEFLGRVLGKAMFEGIVVQPNFAHFFLTKLLGKFSSLSDLASLDEELFRNLMFLKTYKGDARDLMLNFVVTENTLGVTREIELCPQGASLEVTSRNKLRYVYHVANYRLNTKIRPQCQAFLRGLRDLIPVDWLRMFSERELQWLISGSDAAIDIDDLRANTNYTGGYSSLSGGVRKFWNVVAKFTKEERSQLLRFVTSCERAPPLGFKALHPQFNIQWVGGAPNKLPSASTCFNTLKLPSYSSERQCREKLLQSIQSGAGFDLS